LVGALCAFLTRFAPAEVLVLASPKLVAAALSYASVQFTVQSGIRKNEKTTSGHARGRQTLPAPFSVFCAAFA
jgi:hypothetical protein